MTIGDAVDNAAETSGDLNKEAWDKYNLLRSALLTYHDTDGSHLSTSDVVLKALFDANTILYATTDDTPAALTVAASRIVGRASSGAIAALTAAQVLTILSLDSNLADLTATEVQQLENIATTTISAAQWGYLGACGAGGGQLLAALTAAESSQVEAIGTSTISATQWGYLGAMNQALTTGSAVAFTTLNLTGGQIAFPASQSASADANTLDDYEEGTWTPALKFGGANVDMTGTFTGTYTKVGNLVFFLCYILLTNKGTSTGEATITGIPFAIADSFVAAPSLYTVSFADFPSIYGTSSTIYCREVTNAGARTELNDVNFANNSEYSFVTGYTI